MKTKCSARFALLSAVLPLALVATSEISPSAAAPPARDLQVYFIDVEGGQFTLFVTPEKHALPHRPDEALCCAEIAGCAPNRGHDGDASRLRL